MQSFMGFMSNINIFVWEREREDFNVIVKSAFQYLPSSKSWAKNESNPVKNIAW